MPSLLENFGLGFFAEDDSSMMNFLGYLAKNGKSITGYYGCPTLFNSMGNVDLYVKTERREDGQLEVTGLDTHCSGNDVWELRNTGMNLTPKDACRTERLCAFKRNGDGTGLLPIHIINADVLPSFLEDDIVNLQMCALPLEINYYADQEQYENSQPRGEDGRQWLISDGSLFPAALLINHNPERMEENTDCSSDDEVMFTATVKALYHGQFVIGDNSQDTFIRCIADTEFGELVFVHSIDQIKEDQRNNLRPGAIISGVCILSGDAAIDQYERGFVRDAEHNFRLVRQVITNGEAERLRFVLAENAVYVSDASDKTYHGADEIIDRLNFVHSNITEKKEQCFAHAATITGVDEAGMEYSVGTRCIIIAYNTEKEYAAITFVDTGDDGRITRLLITKDRRYHFKIDEPPRTRNLLDDVELPQSVVEPIWNRACFHGFVEDDMDMASLLADNSGSWDTDARLMLDALRDDPQDDEQKAFENIFGYLFAKAIEQTVNTGQKRAGNFGLTASYRPYDAFRGEISTTFCGQEHEKIVDAMRKGKQFYKDFRFYVESTKPSEEQFMEELVLALAFVQHIGSKYALKLFKE